MSVLGAITDRLGKMSPTPQSIEPSFLLVILPLFEVRTVPLGAGYLIEYLKSQGIRCGVLDLNIKLFNQVSEEWHYIWDVSNANQQSPEELANLFMEKFSTF